MHNYFQGHHFATLIRAAVPSSMDMNIALCTFYPNLKLFWTHSEELIHSFMYCMNTKVAPDWRKEQRWPRPLTLCRISKPLVSKAPPQGALGNLESWLRDANQPWTTHNKVFVHERKNNQGSHPRVSPCILAPGARQLGIAGTRSVQWHAGILVRGA